MHFPKEYGKRQNMFGESRSGKENNTSYISKRKPKRVSPNREAIKIGFDKNKITDNNIKKTENKIKSSY